MKNLIVSSSPHIRTKVSTQSIMRDVLIALLPATAAGVFLFGINALITVLVCVASAVASEFLFNLVCKIISNSPLSLKIYRYKKMI